MASRSVRHSLFILLLLTVTLLAGGREARAQIRPVDGLTGRLGVVAGELYLYTLAAEDGETYALLGATPEVEAQLGTLAPGGAWVAVSGILEPISPIAAIPLIVVDVVSELDEAPEAQATQTPRFSVPEQTIAPRRTPSTLPAALATPQPPSPGEIARGTATPTLGMVPTATPRVWPSVTATAGPTAPAGPKAVVTAFAVNVRKGPSGDYAYVGIVRRGAVCTLIGRTANAEWLQLACPELTGWVRAPYVAVEGDLAPVPPTTVDPPDIAAPDATDSLQPPFSWRGLAYANRTLSGPPPVAFDSPVIDFNWGPGPPLEGFPVDNFSMRFDATPRFAPGDYLFALTYDDGARLTIGGDVVINDWTEGAERTSYWQGRLAGDVPISVEYFEAWHVAMVRLTIERLLPIPIRPTPLPAPTSPGALPDQRLPEEQWLAAYFTNPEWAGLPALTRLEPADDATGDVPPQPAARVPLDRAWGSSSPAPTVLGLEGWSARWQGLFAFAQGAQQFEVTGSGRVFLYLDNILILAGELTTDGSPLRAEVTVDAGRHALVAEFIDTLEDAALRVEWLAPASEPLELPPAATLAPDAAPSVAPPEQDAATPAATPSPLPTAVSRRTPTPTPTFAPVGK